jgi:site-specific DNA-methyltransferase (adenine-specific)
MSDIKLYKGDCLEIMKDIPDGSIDMILCDLPYGTTACKWDVVIPFDKLWEQYNRIIKPNGAIVLFGSEPFSSFLRTSNIKMYKYDWIWHKSRPTGFAQAKNQPLRDFENIIVFSKGAAIHANQTKNRMKYNPQGLSDCLIFKNQTKNGRTDTCFSKRKSHKTTHTQTKTGYPRQVLRFSSESNTLHPTQKPIELLEYLIKTYTNEGELVLDNCMGSGSTGVACINTNRNFVGIELDENYFNIAKDRINAAKENL